MQDNEAKDLRMESTFICLFGANFQRASLARLEHSECFLGSFLFNCSVKCSRVPQLLQ